MDLDTWEAVDSAPHACFLQKLKNYGVSAQILFDLIFLKESPNENKADCQYSKAICIKAVAFMCNFFKNIDKLQ